MIIDIARFDSPLGTMIAAVHDGRLCALEFEARWPRRRRALEKRFGTLDLRTAADPAGAVAALRDYFDGKLDALEGLAVDPGGTPFQRRVWDALRRIAPGETVSYADLARTIGAPAAVRAVGAANGANPVCLAIPCHRVIGADGSLTGYAGGMHRKRWLLDHERTGTRAA
jgi:methylated-DNA-[protein]-cysteine S-methyltransferase